MGGKEIFISRFLKISGIFILCGWMFFLGILVGRGTAPVSFDTKSVQKKLAAIATGSKKEQKPEKKLDFDFYEMLQKPAATGNGKLHKADEIIPAASQDQDLKNREAPVANIREIKKSRKAMTFSLPEKKSDTTVMAYTIQIAAYRNLNDALKLMASLKDRGYTPYRTIGKTGNKIWHRVRLGSFKDMASAKKTEKKLESVSIKGIIIKVVQ